MARYEKLVRDMLPEILDAKGVAYEKQTVTGPALRAALIEKLVEEVSEFSAESTTEELADVLEVVLALREFPVYADVEAVREKKRDERGAFRKGIMLRGDDGK